MSGANGTVPALQVLPLPRWLAGSPETARSLAAVLRGAQGVRGASDRQRNGRRVLMLGAVVAAHAGGLALMTHLRSDPPVIKAPAPIYATLVQDVPTPSAPPPPPKPAKPTPQVTPRPTSRVMPVPDASPAPAPSAPAQDSTPSPAPVVHAEAPAPVPVVPAAPRTITHGVQYLRAPVLVYPEASRRTGEEGVVSVRVLVGIDGLPREVIVRQSSGSPALDAAGVRAVQQAVFKPYTEDGKPQAVYVIVPLRFSLDT